MSLPNKSVITNIKVEVESSESLGLILPAFIPAPELISPDNSRAFSTRNSVEFTWSAVSGADLYEFQISEDSRFDLWNTKTIRTASTSLTLGHDSEIEYPLKHDVQHYWRVRAIVGFHSSLWSEHFSFRIIPPEDVELPMGPWIEELEADHDEIKPLIGEGDVSLNVSNISVIFTDDAGPVDSYRWRLAGPGSLEDQTASSVKFIAPTISEAGGVNQVCNAGPGSTSTITFVARNKGGSNSQDVKINVRFQAGDLIPENPTRIGAIWYEPD